MQQWMDELSEKQVIKAWIITKIIINSGLILILNSEQVSSKLLDTFKKDESW